MNEKELKMKFEEIKGLRDFERGNFTAAVWPVINYSGFANGFFLEVNDAVEFLEKGGDIKELKKIVEEKVGKWESSEKKFF